MDGYDTLAAFSIPANVSATLSLCQSPPCAGEVKACTTSLEGTVRSAMDMLGADKDGGGVWVVTSTVLRGGLPQ
ncbi:hypothetical protein EJB05_51643 [Eragrostis curvula]|uniref:BURP domain-containing protein n=1 Tax=Eragrostis curvula TaxID=38414 RepID=A0A5J9SVA8_9POAL|nr:hypothetical protein EJB05_51643 [Eragrostis curvula]